MPGSIAAWPCCVRATGSRSAADATERARRRRTGRWSSGCWAGAHCWSEVRRHGTDHDPQLWPEPDRFDPDRFAGRTPDPYSFVPQGGADPATGHRCAGERVTVELLKSALRALTKVSYL